MPLRSLQRLSARFFSALWRGLARARAWVQARPGWAAWFDARSGKGFDANYRDFNGWYFAHFAEQERMLADKPRMDFYHQAIGRHVQPGDRVIDLGTGTGILAAFAARRGAAKVYAIEHSGILRHARALAEHNGIGQIEFVAAHSRDFVLSEPVDVIVHEQMGDWLFDESMVVNVCDLRDRMLKPGGIILPSRFELYCEPVQLRDERRVPFIWELEVHGYDFSCLDRERPQDPGYYALRGGDLGLISHRLSEAEPVLEIDLQTLRPDGLPAEVHFTRTVLRPGRLDGFAVYFSAQVDADLVLSSDPLDPGRAPHWGFRILRVEREDFAVGDVIEVTLKAAPWAETDSWRWSYRRLPALARALDWMPGRG